MKKIRENLHIEGKFIILRSPTIDDWKSFQTILSDTKTMQFLLFLANQPDGWTEEQAKERLRRRIEEQKKQKGIFFTVIENSEQEIAGSCGFTAFDLEKNTGEFGIIIHHPFWGTNVAVECHLLALAYGFEELDLDRIEFATAIENVRMQKFFDKYGVTYELTDRKLLTHYNVTLDRKLYALEKKAWPDVKEKLTLKVDRE